MWKVIDNDVFPWSTGIVIDEDKVKRIHETGVNIEKAADDIKKTVAISMELKNRRIINNN